MDFEKLHREESGRILSTLIGMLGDFDLAEEALQEAYATALQKWPEEGTPANPRAWLISTARNKAIDQLRRGKRLDEKRDAIAHHLDVVRAPERKAEEMFADDRLRLIFTCCHPALATDAQVALTLRTVCGLTTEEIAKAFLLPVATLAQRLVRAKRKIRDAGIPYREPLPEDLPERVESVLLAIYLIFNEGYLASGGDALVRRELCAEAIRLGRLVCALLPREREAQSLLALMLLHDSRRDARLSSDGDLILLEEQDRSLWHRAQIREGSALVESALRGGANGFYTLQASIAALHANAPTAGDTDWPQIAGLYDLLVSSHPSPVLEVNRAVAIAMATSLTQGLALLDALEEQEELSEFYLLPAARADLLRRLGRKEEAATAYRQALQLVSNDIERRFLLRRYSEMTR